MFLPQSGGVFLQAESEVAAINMLYGAASAGVRVMTASSFRIAGLLTTGEAFRGSQRMTAIGA